jgi:RNA polymerase sigma-70 factor (ECF subfamily)
MTSIAGFFMGECLHGNPAMDESISRPRHVTGEMTAAAGAVRVSSWVERDRTWHEFLARVAQGDRDAFAALYDSTSALVYSLVIRIVGNRADAEEVTLDVYLQVWRDARRFDSVRGGVRSWLAMLARSRALDRRRSQASQQSRVTETVEEERASEAPTPEALSALSQHRRAVAEAMSALPKEQREVINLAYFDGLSQTEMAEQLGLPLGTVKTRVRLGMMRLRDLIGGQNN